MDIYLNPSFLQEFTFQNSLVVIAWLFLRGGWIIFVIVFLWGIWHVRLIFLQRKYFLNRHWTLLAIDVPKDNEQTPKVVEQLFSNLSGIHSNINFVEKYFQGKTQDYFSLEIVSLGGYIQFLIRTVASYRDLVEAAVYAQYPEAEIVEIGDYTEDAPIDFPNEEYELWGTELVLFNKDAYPIRTYPEFEEKLTQEFKDPISALLEIMSKIQKGEQIWLQLIIVPTGSDWKKKSDEIVNKMMGVKEKPKNGIVDKILDVPLKILEMAGEAVWPTGFGGKEVKLSKEEMMPLMRLSPGEKNVLEAVQRKASKIGFKVKFRMIYLGRHEVFSKARGVSAVIGAISQFNTLDMNGFKPGSHTKTKIDYFFVKRRVAARQRRIIGAYKERNPIRGESSYILNIEELATLFHFPMMEIKVPLVKKTEAKRGRAPVGLPVEELAEEKRGYIRPEVMRGKKTELPIGLPAEEEEWLEE
ncbi:MAG: hypothetical protein COX43_01735 [Parcubacteria group bacterium CG23_combo_of_CG06-09_8_20_14_all_35_9]|nr:MAG: hypothetical protein COX43_01735 [Parcubacteria group bacterium CG23_combo_of_CG06-09_8_20_14_all_35_9]